MVGESPPLTGAFWWACGRLRGRAGARRDGRNSSVPCARVRRVDLVPTVCEFALSFLLYFDGIVEIPPEIADDTAVLIKVKFNLQAVLKPAFN